MNKDELYNYLTKLKTEYHELLPKCEELNLTSNYKEHAAIARRINILANEIMKHSAKLFQKYHIYHK